MAVVAWSRLRMLWGALDWQQGSDHPYTSAQTYHGGTNAAGPNPNVGIRKCVINFDRSAKGPPLDAMNCHLSFLNITAGAPDDTWTTSDYTTLEGYITTMLTACASLWSSTTKVTMLTWYRQGAGIGPPNPAERQVTGLSILGSVSSPLNAPQVACTLTLRTAVRQSWGRTYLPAEAILCGSNGHFASSVPTTVTNAANTLVSSASAADFILGVYSSAKTAFLAAEHVECDDVPDVIRHRRPRTPVTRVIVP